MLVFSGAQEIDMVINIAALKDKRYDVVEEEIWAVTAAAKDKAIVKVIIECCLLTDEEKVKACELSLKAGAGFVKTSTGFSTGGATINDVKLMRSIVGDKAGVKASGGIRDYETAMAMITAGATRIGTSSGVEIMKQAKISKTKHFIKRGTGFQRNILKVHAFEIEMLLLVTTAPRGDSRAVVQESSCCIPYRIFYRLHFV